MHSRYLKILGVVSVFSMITALSLFAGPSDIVMDRSVTPTSDIQYYYAVHGIVQTLKNMVSAELRNEFDLYGDPATISMTLGTTTFTLPASNLVALQITTPDSTQNGANPASTNQNVG
ncbi:MAG TPA: hypothetical protein VFH83_06560 [Spirochaetia bacterium]|nr:hypothetical protein [Spirochaetia bacterium]